MRLPISPPGQLLHCENTKFIVFNSTGITIFVYDTITVTMNRIILNIGILLLLFALGACSSHNEILAPVPEDKGDPHITIISVPSAKEGNTNVLYTFSSIQRDIPNDAVCKWFITDVNAPIVLPSNRSLQFTFTHDGFFFIVLEAYSKDTSQLLARSTFRANIRSSVPQINEIRIEKGSFSMGKSTEVAESPVRNVSVTSSFYITDTEITQQQWSALYGHNPAWFKGDHLPVETVSWFEALEFCNSLSLRFGFEPCYSFINDDSVLCDFSRNGFRLPTEMEWEYAARAGTNNDTPFGNISSTLDGCLPLDTTINRTGWYCGNSGFTTMPVASKEPNAWGLYDMIGNVQEWCWDWFDSYYYTYSPATDARGPQNGTLKSCRGGSWYNQVFQSRLAARQFYRPSNRTNMVGFRIVRKAD